MNAAYSINLHLGALVAAVDTPSESLALTPGGWTVMVASIGVVVVLVSYCLYRVLSLPAVDLEDIEGPLTIDTGDTQDAD